MGQTLGRASLITPEVVQFANRKFVLSIGVNQINGLEVPPMNIRVINLYIALFFCAISTADSSFWTRLIS